MGQVALERMDRWESNIPIRKRQNTTRRRVSFWNSYRLVKNKFGFNFFLWRTTNFMVQNFKKTGKGMKEFNCVMLYVQFIFKSGTYVPRTEN